MYDNYPMGAANDPNAPYNQPSDPDPIDIDVEFSCVIRKTTKVGTTRYQEFDWEDSEPDGEGGYVHTGGTDYEFDDNDFRDEFAEQRYNPAELIDELKTIVTMLIDGEDVTISKPKLKHILEDCDGWEIDDEECRRDGNE